MTQEIIAAEFAAIRLISKGFQVCAVAQDEQGQWDTFADQKSVMPSLMDGLKSSKGMSHSFGKLLEWAQSNECTHIVAFTNIPYDEPLILLKVRD